MEKLIPCSLISSTIFAELDPPSSSSVTSSFVRGLSAARRLAEPMTESSPAKAIKAILQLKRCLTLFTGETNLSRIEGSYSYIESGGRAAVASRSMWIGLATLAQGGQQAPSAFLPPRVQCSTSKSLALQHRWLTQQYQPGALSRPTLVLQTRLTQLAGIPLRL